jgi:hypothetical protein
MTAAAQGMNKEIKKIFVVVFEKQRPIGEVTKSHQPKQTGTFSQFISIYFFDMNFLISFYSGVKFQTLCLPFPL